MHRSVTVVAAIIVALVRGWQLGLVMLALMPLIAIAGGIRSTLTTWGTKRQSEAFSKANGLSSQAIQNVRTCLLYTSPSPRDRTRSRMPSSA